MKAWRARTLATGALIGLALPLAATASEPTAPNGALRPLLDCRKIGEAAERLACFDKESATLDEADRKNELAVMGKEDVRKTRRSLFGLNLSGLPFIGGDGQTGGEEKKSEREEEGFTQITAKIASARSLGFDKWAFDLDDGAHWVTTEGLTFKDPAPGMTVVIKKGTLGGFAASFDGGIRQVKVRRVN